MRCSLESIFPILRKLRVGFTHLLTTMADCSCVAKQQHSRQVWRRNQEQGVPESTPAQLAPLLPAGVNITRSDAGWISVSTFRSEMFRPSVTPTYIAHTATVFNTLVAEHSHGKYPCLMFKWLTFHGYVKQQATPSGLNRLRWQTIEAIPLLAPQEAIPRRTATGTAS